MTKSRFGTLHALRSLTARRRQLALRPLDLMASVEVVSVLRPLAVAGEASAAQAQEAVEDLLDLPIERYAHDILATRIWALRELTKS